MKFLEKINKTIRKYSMLSEGDSVLIGLSGGPDSVCLTIILDKLRDNFNLSLYAVYINHGLRPDEIVREISSCRSLCDRLGIRFIPKSINLEEYVRENNLNLQEAARDLRYRMFEKISEELRVTKLALGHNADDQAETVLMRLVRGAGRRGMSGIPPVRGNIIRPLIDIKREEIEAYLAEVNEPFLTDSSNLKEDYFRNWLRHNIIPEIKKQNPSFVDSIVKSAEIFRDEDAYLEVIVTKTLMRLITGKTDNSIELFLIPLENIEKPILRRIMRRVLSEIGVDRGIDLGHVDDILRLIKENQSGDMLNLPRGIRVVKKYSTLLLTTEELSSGFTPCAFEVPGKVTLEEAGIVINAEVSETMQDGCDGKMTAVLDFDRLVFPLYIRMREDGDFFYPAGFGMRKKLQDFFVDCKVPHDERDSVPIIVSGEDIVWIAGYRMDERFTAKDDTKKFLNLRIIQDV